MFRKLMAFSVVLAIAAGSLAGSVPARASQAPAPERFVSGQVIVRGRDGFDPANIPASVVRHIPELGAWAISVPAGDEAAWIASLQARPDVAWAEYNGIVEVLETTPNDPLWSQQYGPARIQAPLAWDLNTGGEVILSVIDTGVYCNHPDIIGKCVPGYDFVNGDEDPNDDHGHGTHVAGIAAAVTNNAVGIAGVCWGCRIQPVKMLGANGSGTWDAAAAAVVWATNHGSAVINMSFGGSSYSQVMQDAVRYAYSSGVLLFAAAGNSGTYGVSYPARYAEVVAVAASDQFDKRASFSTYGPEVELTAPGVSNLSTVPDYACGLCAPSGYRSLSGTSMATPHSAGAGAVVVSYFGIRDPALARGILTSSARDLGEPGRDDYYGYGLVDLYAALSGQQPPTPTPTLVPTETPRPTEGPPPTETPVPEPGTAVCGKYTGGAIWQAAGSPYYFTCDVDIKGGLAIVGAEVQLRGHQLSVGGQFYIFESTVTR